MSNTPDGDGVGRQSPARAVGTNVEVVTFGEALAAFLADPPGTPLSAASTFRRRIAGAEFNLAIGLARLGHRVAWSGRVGDDTQGQLVIKSLRAECVDVSGVIVDSAPTGVLVRDCHVNRTVDVNYFRTCSAGSRLRPDDLDLDHIRRSRVLAVSGVTAALSESAFAATLAAAQAAREAGVTVAFDPNIRLKLAPLATQLDGLRQLCKYADVILAGENEALAISGATAVDENPAEWFLGQGCSLVVVKRGAAGAWATNGTNTWHQQAYAVHAVDPVGAGDAFAAGFISGYLRADSVPASLRRAAGCGALNVSVVGDFEGSPTESELVRFLAGSDDVHR